MHLSLVSFSFTKLHDQRAFRNKIHGRKAGHSAVSILKPGGDDGGMLVKVGVEILE